MVEYARTDIAKLATEIAPLLRANWEERHNHAPKYSLAPDLDVYCEAEEKGWLHLFTARIDGALVGYEIVFATHRPHAPSETVGAVDALYVVPKHRTQGVAAGLLAFGEKHLKDAGVNTVAIGAQDPRVIRWLRMTSGYRYAETLLEKEL